MKVVKLSHPNYEYDVHSLVKAFYAEDQVTVITPETKPEKLAELEPQVSLEIELAETGAKIRVGEEDFLWDAETENLADGYKNGLKRFLYRTLSKVTGQKLPWGNLTGIRPTKIAYGMLDEGRSDAEILEFMEQSHYVSEEKALLGIDIAKRERDLLKEIHYEGGYSLYIGIPFCPTTCLYCSFTSYPIIPQAGGRLCGRSDQRDGLCGGELSGQGTGYRLYRRWYAHHTGTGAAGPSDHGIKVQV